MYLLIHLFDYSSFNFFFKKKKNTFQLDSLYAKEGVIARLIVIEDPDLETSVGWTKSVDDEGMAFR